MSKFYLVVEEYLDDYDCTYIKENKMMFKNKVLAEKYIERSNEENLKIQEISLSDEHFTHLLEEQTYYALILNSRATVKNGTEEIWEEPKHQVNIHVWENPLNIPSKFTSFSTNVIHAREIVHFYARIMLPKDKTFHLELKDKLIEVADKLFMDSFHFYRTEAVTCGDYYDYVHKKAEELLNFPLEVEQ